MRLCTSVVSLMLIVGAIGCDSGTGIASCCDAGLPAVRVVNASPSPVNLLVDGTVVSTSLAAGAIDTLRLTSGSHVLALSQTGTTATGARSVEVAAGALPTIAVLLSNGIASTATLDDTNDVVPAGATKLRVLHFAPNAGTLQVYRTQPDYQQPIAWQFPFTYQSNPTSLSAPFFQSTVGTWEVHIWQTPADASGWATAPLKVLVPLASGEKHTIIILDKDGGGVRAVVI